MSLLLCKGRPFIVPFLSFLIFANGEYKNRNRFRSSNLSIYGEVETGYNP